MSKYIKSLTLDILGAPPRQRITAKQGDNKSRYLKITLVDGDTKVVLDESENVDFRCIKPDDTSCILPSTKEADGTILVELDKQVLAVDGEVRADVVITDDNGMILSSTYFFIDVEPAATNGNYIPSTSNQKMARSLDMNGYGIQNLPTPTDDGDAVNKGYVDEQIKEVEIPVDDTLDENSTNAIQNAVVAEEVQKLKKKWYTLPMEKFKEKPWKLGIYSEKATENDGQPIYGAIIAFQFYGAKGEGEDLNLIALTDIPFEFNNDTDKSHLDWTNKDKFPTIGIISNQMGAEPVDLYKQIEAMVDGSTFYKVDMFMDLCSSSIVANSVGYYKASFCVAIYSRIEAAIDLFMEEISQIIPTITHFCIFYENYEVVEANGIGE